MTAESKRSLSPARRALVELMQKAHFGRIENLVVRDAQPVLNPPPRVVKDFLFGKVNAPNPALVKEDFVLRSQVVELFEFFDRESAVEIEALIIQSGLPLRMTVARVP